MGNEGQDNSQPPVNEVNKHPWEIFPEANSSDAKKSAPSEAELEKKRLKREKRDARRNSRNLWIKKHKILSLGIFLVLVALIVGAVFLVIFLTTPKEAPAAVPDDDYEQPAKINIEDYEIDDIPNGELLLIKLNAEAKADIIDNIYTDSILSCAKIMDNGNAFIKRKGDLTKEHKIIYTLYVYYVAVGYKCYSDVSDFFDDFDRQKNELNNKQRYLYNYIKYKLYAGAGDTEKGNSYYDIWNDEYNKDRYYYDSEEGKFIKVDF